MSGLRIVVGNGSLAWYPEGGGHWSVFLQYVLGLRALRHEVFWLELLQTSGDRSRDRKRIEMFLRRFKQYGLEGRCAVIFCDDGPQEQRVESATVYGMSRGQVEETAQSADLLWNFCCAFQGSLLWAFRRRVLIDLDPGHLQVSAVAVDMGVHDHHIFLSVGSKLHDADCQAPTLGVRWHRFMPFVHLPAWRVACDPGPEAPFSSVTQWTWEELWWQDQVLSVSKRDAYLRYVELPRQVGRPFELAANIHPDDASGDRELLRDNAWRLVHPHRVSRSPSAYRHYIQRSRAEFSCPQPIHVKLRTGWFSDRSAAYLATGRPVLAEDTGFGERLPTGLGLVTFRDLSEAIAGVTEIDAAYPQHARAARELAEEFFDSRRCLQGMLAACGY